MAARFQADSLLGHRDSHKTKVRLKEVKGVALGFTQTTLDCRAFKMRFYFFSSVISPLDICMLKDIVAGEELLT